MPLTAGARLGPYEVISALGAGGMGEVYRARDTELGRDVAIKILPEVFAADADRVARFQREAQVLASLNHPNIAQIYGLERVGDSRALVLELVQGPTLADRIARGPIPVDEALPMARQIAEALEAAHGHGIIHRDLKPANIKLRDDGTVKVLDFGLAKLALPESVSATSPALTQSPTITSPALMTAGGVILGTAAYMSPEQARGKAVDQRSDIWAFGCVLYEMLTAHRPFQGDDITETIAAVMKDQPDLTRVPVELRRLLKVCLEKDPKKRLQSIGDMPLLIDNGGSRRDPLTRFGQMGIRWGITLAALLFATAVAFIHFREARPPAVERMRFDIAFPDGTRPTERSVPALSADGRRLAFVATSADGKQRLWVRAVDAPEATPIAGTEGAFGSPFWSPDGRFVAYLDNGSPSAPKLRRVDASGGPPQIICDFPGTLLRGGLWTAGGEVVFAARDNSSAVVELFRVPAAGGTAASLTMALDGDVTHVYPVLLPDGRRFLYSRTSSDTERNGVFVGSLDVEPQPQVSTRLLRDSTNVVFVAANDPGPGVLLFVREGTLMAQRFDHQTLALLGEPQPIAEQVSVADPDIFHVFTATPTTLIYLPEGFFQDRQRAWLNREGETIQRLGDPGFYGGVWLSDDGRRAAFQRRDGQIEDLWLFEFDRGAFTRFTTNATRNWSAVWSPSGNELVFVSSKGGIPSVYHRVVGGPDTEEMIVSPGVPLDWSPDGQYVLFNRAGDLWAVRAPQASNESMPVQLSKTSFAETQARFSSDGRWVAIQSDESGRNEIYVRPFETLSGGMSLGERRTLISIGGGSQPRWRADGRELFYLSDDEQVMAVPITSDEGGIRAGAPAALFSLPPRTSWDVAPDGQRFLTVQEGQIAPPFKVILNWQQGLQ